MHTNLFSLHKKKQIIIINLVQRTKYVTAVTELSKLIFFNQTC